MSLENPRKLLFFTQERAATNRLKFREFAIKSPIRTVIKNNFCTIQAMQKERPKDCAQAM